MGPGWADICLICSVLRSLICLPSLRFLELHQEALEFWRECVGVDGGWRQLIRQRLRRLALVLGNPAETPMNRYPDLEGFLAVDLHRPDAPGDHCLRDVVTANAADLHPVAATDAEFVCQFDRVKVS